jgi:hypothetical protein
MEGRNGFTSRRVRGLMSSRTLAASEIAVNCSECGAPGGSPCTEGPQRWECDCGQGDPPVHEICSFCGEDWGTCNCTERVCEEPHQVRVSDAEREADTRE